MNRTLRVIASLILLPILLLSCESKLPEGAKIANDSTAYLVPSNSVEAFAAIDTTLRDSLRLIERLSGGKLGVAAYHIESGWKTSYRGGETFPMASVGKLPMAIAFLRLVDAKRYRLDSVVRLTTADQSLGGSHLFRRVMHDSGGATKLHTLLEAMIINSDNTCADYLLRLAGGPRPVDSLMKLFRLPNIDVSNSEGDLILMWAGVDPRQADSTWTRTRMYEKMKEAGDSAWREAAVKMANDPTDAAPPEDIVRLLSLLKRGKLLEQRSTDTLLAMMSRAVTGKGRIPLLLPAGTPVAHKTGTISSTTNDVGIITLPGGQGHLVVAFFVKGSVAPMRTREQAIARAAALIYRHVAK